MVILDGLHTVLKHVTEFKKGAAVG